MRDERLLFDYIRSSLTAQIGSAHQASVWARLMKFPGVLRPDYSNYYPQFPPKRDKKGTKSCHFRVKYFCIVRQLCQMVGALTFSYNHQKKVLTIILAIMFGLVVSKIAQRHAHIICALVLHLPKNIFCPSKGTRRNGRFLRRRTGLPPFPFAAQTTLKILTELLCKPLSGRAPTMNKEFFVPRKGQNHQQYLQLFTIRDPLEVGSAKARRFVLIPNEKLKLSRHRHDHKGK